MTAYFYSIFIKQTRMIGAAALLSFCLLASHWVGYTHSISHSHSLSQYTQNSCTDDVNLSFNHSSDFCQLFDGLTLAGFIGSIPNLTPIISSAVLWVASLGLTVLSKISEQSYLSRAPPTLSA